MKCQFNGKHIVASHFVNSTLIQCTAHAALYSGTVFIGLVLDGIPISTGPQQHFTFVSISVSFINPSFGDLIGGTPVKHFLQDNSSKLVSHCIFGKRIVPASLLYSELVCISPPLPDVGPALLGLIVNGEDFSMIRFTF